MITNNLLEVPKDEAFPDKNYFIFAGFCVLASFFSKRFLNDLYVKVNKVEKTAEEAKKVAQGVENKSQKLEEIAKETKENIENKIAVVGADFDKIKHEINFKVKEIQNEIINEKEEEKEAYKRTSIEVVEEENSRENTMLVFAAGQSLKENLEYNLYYDPAS